MRSATRKARRRFRACSLCLEALEDRCLLSAGVVQTNLVSDVPGVANVTDANLVNPWGLSASPTGPFWISEAGASTPYNSAPNTPQPLVVSIPSPGNPFAAAVAPTGTVFNIAYGSKGFLISDGVHSAPATFLFATTDGTIAAWNPKVDPTGRLFGGSGSTHAVIAVDYSPGSGSVYKADYRGLTIATDQGGNTYLYAANAKTGRVDVFDSNFQRVILATGAFVDPYVPRTYTPFNVQVFGDQVFVTYSKYYYAGDSIPNFPGNGFIDVFNLDGTGGHRLVSRGPLDSPWGMAIAPASFGALAGSLMVGNFGNGRINFFDLHTGAFFGTLNDASGMPLEIDGLWALKVGNGSAGGDASTVYFTAGLDQESHGLFGALTAIPSTVPAPVGPVQTPSVQTPASNQQTPTGSQQNSDATSCDTPGMGTNSSSTAPSSSIATGSSNDATASQSQSGSAVQADGGAAISQSGTSFTTTSAPINGCPLPTFPTRAEADSTPTDLKYPAVSYGVSELSGGAEQTRSYPSSHEVTAFLLGLAGAAQGYYRYYEVDGDTDATVSGNGTGKSGSKQDAVVFVHHDADGSVQPIGSPTALVGLVAVESMGIARGEAAAAAADSMQHVSLNAAEDGRGFSNLPDVMALGLLARGARAEESLEALLEEAAAAEGGFEDIVRASPRLGTLAGGTLMVDLANLRGAIDKFFARLENVAEELVGLPQTHLLAQWLLAGAAATGMFEFVRRGSKRGRCEDEEQADESTWAPFPMLVIAPPEDAP